MLITVITHHLMKWPSCHSYLKMTKNRTKLNSNVNEYICPYFDEWYLILPLNEWIHIYLCTNVYIYWWMITDNASKWIPIYLCTYVYDDTSDINYLNWWIAKFILNWWSEWLMMMMIADYHLKWFDRLWIKWWWWL